MVSRTSGMFAVKRMVRRRGGGGGGGSGSFIIKEGMWLGWFEIASWPSSGLHGAIHLESISCR